LTDKDEKKVCFAVTPIGSQESEVRRRSNQILRHIIKPVVEELGYKNVRADEIAQPGMITDQVIRHLLEADLVVADLTGGNPNVFYELGIRHATRKPVVSIMEVNERIPFDVNQSRTISVNHRDLDSAEECRNTLKSQILSLEENPRDFFNPVSMTIDLKSMYDSGDPNLRRDAQLVSALQTIQTDIAQLQNEIREFRSQETEKERTERQNLFMNAAIRDRLTYRDIDLVKPRTLGQIGEDLHHRFLISSVERDEEETEEAP
jgi:nucleoside 2-deoxyribosyltransferase